MSITGAKVDFGRLKGSGGAGCGGAEGQQWRGVREVGRSTVVRDARGLKGSSSAGCGGSERHS